MNGRLSPTMKTKRVSILEIHSRIKQITTTNEITVVKFLTVMLFAIWFKFNLLSSCPYVNNHI